MDAPRQFSPQDDFYKDIGVELEGRDPVKVPYDEIQAAYRRMNSKWHEGKHAKAPAADRAKAAEMWQKANAAKTVLLDNADLRDQYHDHLEWQASFKKRGHGFTGAGGAGHTTNAGFEGAAQYEEAMNVFRRFKEQVARRVWDDDTQAAYDALKKIIPKAEHAELDEGVAKLRQAFDFFNQRGAGSARAGAAGRGASAPPRPPSSGGSGTAVSGSGGYSGGRSTASTLEAEAKGGKWAVITAAVVAAVGLGYVVYNESEKQRAAKKKTWQERTQGPVIEAAAHVR
ncbi:MAG: hypothetical protein V4735_09155 [Pseudomonadota bacterium]